MKIFFAIISLLIALGSFGQDKKYDCFKRNNFTFKQRLNNYPFNITKSVMLISFEDTSNYLPLKTSPFSKFKETKSLNSVQIDSLTNLLYNFGVKGSTFKYTPAACYVPRNAILFLNSKGKVFEFIEICFECHRTRVSSKRIDDGISCNQKFNILKSYFIRQGIKYGTTD